MTPRVINGHEIKPCADLRGADLSNADLRGADLSDADLRGADLRGAALRCADLRGASLCNASLCNAKLRGADLLGADLRGASLCNADMRAANLRSANLHHANMSGAIVDEHGGHWDVLCWPWLHAHRYDAEMRVPGVVRIGCTTCTIDDWLGEQGQLLAEREGCLGSLEQQTLVSWLEMLRDVDPERLGWRPGT
jgi:uncharacterized protein YjbI with pentapeptide repeats